jgi:hypothetical protein
MEDLIISMRCASLEAFLLCRSMFQSSELSVDCACCNEGKTATLGSCAIVL